MRIKELALNHLTILQCFGALKEDHDGDAENQRQLATLIIEPFEFASAQLVSSVKVWEETDKKHCSPQGKTDMKQSSG